MATNPSLTDIRMRRKVIADQKHALEAEDQDLADLERALEKFAKRSLPISPAPASKPAAPSVPRPAKPGTERLIIDTLWAGPLWTTAREIRKAVSAAKGKEVPMSSISPTLTDMKKRGVLTRRGMEVALTERLNKEEKKNQAAE